MVLRALNGHLGPRSRSLYRSAQPRLVALHEPEHCRVAEFQVPEPESFATLPVTLATCPKRSNRKVTTPRELIWPDASMGVSPAELTRLPETIIIHW
jgi:hypothetical protein